MTTYTTGSAISSGPFGVDVTKTYNEPEFDLGTKVVFTDGSIFRFVRTAAAKNQYSILPIDSDWLVGVESIASNLVTVAPSVFGIPAIAIAAPATGKTYRYFWIQTAGLFTAAKFCAGTAKDNPCYLSSATGALFSVYGASASIAVQAIKYTGSSQITGTTGTFTTGAAYSPIELWIDPTTKA